MKTIRNGVFETNSSSCHSFTINRSTVTANQDNYVIDLYANGEYGWSGSDVWSPAELLDYACVAFSMTVNDTREFNKILKNVIKYFKTRGVIINKKFKCGKGYWGLVNGYIDHQSGPGENNECTEIANMFYDPEKLYNFVFGNSYIELDNDNH